MPEDGSFRHLHESVSGEFLVTSLCNMSCVYCIARHLPGSAMNIEVARRAVDLFMHLSDGAKVAEFTFTGGEPLTEFSVLKRLTRYAQARARSAGMESRFILKTNGTIVDAAVVDFIKEHAVRVVISIDGDSPIHDEHRQTTDGKGTHFIVRSNIATLLDNGIPCVASITVHPNASALVLKSVRYLHQLGIKQIDVGPVYGTVQWTEGNCRDLVNSLMDVACFIREVNNEGKQLEVGPLYRDSEHVEEFLTNRWGCHAASTNLAFAPNGQVTGCSALAMLIHSNPGLVIGDVFNGLDQAATDHIIQLAQAPPENRPQCLGCKYSPNCTGGCLAINYATTASALIPPQIYCQTIAAIPDAWRRAWQE